MAFCTVSSVTLSEFPFDILRILENHRSLVVNIVLSIVHVQHLHPRVFLHPGCILCHVNGVLRKYTRVKKYTRVQICPYFRGGAN